MIDMEIVKDINSLADYLLAIQEFNNSYKGFAANPTVNSFLYRGVSNEAYKLIPSVFRKSHDIDITINDYIDNDKYIAFATEKQIIKDFMSEACAYLRMGTADDIYKWVEYAQHYGVPTRYLDWTENPLVALYFACRDNKPDYKKEAKLGGKDAAVWVVHIQDYRRYANQVDNIIYGNDAKKKYTIAETINKIYDGHIMMKYPMIYKPYYSDTRMRAQSSMFMVWGKEIKAFEDMFSDKKTLKSNEFRNSGRSLSGRQNKDIVYKFYISKYRKQSLLRELESCGISEKTLFPGLDGIGRYVEMKYRFDIEEAKESF